MLHVLFCVPSALSYTTHKAKYFGPDTDILAGEIFSLSASLMRILTGRWIQQIMYKRAPSLTHSYNMSICFFSII